MPNKKQWLCALLSGALLFSATSLGYAWNIYDSEYGMDGYEQSKTAVTDDMEEYRQNDSLESLVYTIRDDGSAMITSYSVKFMGNPDSGFGLEFNIPSVIDSHPRYSDR